MQQENNKMQQKLIIADQLIRSQQEVIKSLELCLEVQKERVEMFKEHLSMYMPGMPHDFEWKRIYLPVKDKIQSPPFSKN
jgi:hypothetical protein